MSRPRAPYPDRLLPAEPGARAIAHPLCEGVRILPTLRAELAAGRRPIGAARVVDAGVCHLRGQGAPVAHAAAAPFLAAASGEVRQAGLDPARATDDDVVNLVEQGVGELTT